MGWSITAKFTHWSIHALFLLHIGQSTRYALFHLLRDNHAQVNLLRAISFLRAVSYTRRSNFNVLVHFLAVSFTRWYSHAMVPFLFCALIHFNALL
jgi:hypothetical protein